MTRRRQVHVCRSELHSFNLSVAVVLIVYECNASPYGARRDKLGRTGGFWQRYKTPFILARLGTLCTFVYALGLPLTAK